MCKRVTKNLYSIHQFVQVSTFTNKVSNNAIFHINIMVCEYITNVFLSIYIFIFNKDIGMARLCVYVNICLFIIPLLPLKITACMLLHLIKSAPYLTLIWSKYWNFHSNEKDLKLERFAIWLNECKKKKLS